YIYTDKGHEEESVKIAHAFLKQQEVSEDMLNLVEQLILATKRELEPKHKLEGIIKDADCGHLASEDFIDISDNLLKEINAKNQNQLSEAEWMKQNLEFLKNHLFYSN